MADPAKLQKLAAECRRLQQEIEETIASIPDNVLGELDMPSVLAAIELAGDALNSLAETNNEVLLNDPVQP